MRCWPGVLLILVSCTDPAPRVVVIADQHGAPVAEITTVNGSKHGDARFFHRSGELLRSGRYDRDLKVGTWTTYAPGGRLTSAIGYREGKLNDTCRWWSPEGQLMAEEPYLEGRRHGLLRRWFADGAPRQVVAYDHGQPVGAYHRYLREGDTTVTGSVIEGEYHKGMCQGTWYSFTGDGRKMSEGRFVDNLRQGTWRFWNRRGELVREEDYVDNRRTAVRDHP